MRSGTAVVERQPIKKAGPWTLFDRDAAKQRRYAARQAHDGMVWGCVTRPWLQVIADGAFTKLYCQWDAAGSDRFVRNCACYLAADLSRLDPELPPAPAPEVPVGGASGAGGAAPAAPVRPQLPCTPFHVASIHCVTL